MSLVCTIHGSLGIIQQRQKVYIGHEMALLDGPPLSILSEDHSRPYQRGTFRHYEAFAEIYIISPASVHFPIIIQNNIGRWRQIVQLCFFLDME